MKRIIQEEHHFNINDNNFILDKEEMMNQIAEVCTIYYIPNNQINSFSFTLKNNK